MAQRWMVQTKALPHKQETNSYAAVVIIDAQARVVVASMGLFLVRSVYRAASM